MSELIIERLKARVKHLEARLAAHDFAAGAPVKLIKITCDKKWGWIAWPMDAEIERDADGIWFDVNCQHRGDQNLFTAISYCHYEDEGVHLPSQADAPMVIEIREAVDGKEKDEES